MSAPQVYRAISAVSRALSGEGIAKRHRNERDDYRYRSIDDVLNRLSPLLVKNRLCVLPRVLERTAVDRVGDCDLLLVSVTLRIAFDLVSTTDGSSHTIESFGEALDASDKATAKAMSSAYKHAMLQLFCVPVAQIDDADAGSHRMKRSRTHASEPVEGWEIWSKGIIDIAGSCASPEALESLQDRYRPLLRAISREQPQLYAQLGTAVSMRATVLNGESIEQASKTGSGRFRGSNRAHNKVISTLEKDKRTTDSAELHRSDSRGDRRCQDTKCDVARDAEDFDIATSSETKERNNNVSIALSEPA